MNYLTKLVKALVFLIISLTPLAACFALDCGSLETAHKNIDGSEIFAVWRDCPKNLIELSVSIKRAGSKKSETLTYLELERNPGPAFGADLKDVDKDGFMDLQITGACGNSVCEETILRFDPKSYKFYDFYIGGGNIEVYGNHLISYGRSSAASWEYNFYRIPKTTRLIGEKDHDFLIEVEVSTGTGEDTSSISKCRFKRFKNGDLIEIRPVAKKFLRFCEHYGADNSVDKLKTE